MAFNISDFRTVIASSGGLMRNNRFLVRFVAPRGMTKGNSSTELMSYYCKAAPLPGIGILTSDIYRYGYGPIERKPYGTVVNDAMMMFYTDGSNKMRSWFRNWTRLIINTDSSGRGVKFGKSDAYEYGYKEDYMVDLEIIAYDSEGTPSIRIVLHEAFPNFVGDVQMDWQDNNSIMLLPVSITYKDWSELTVTDLGGEAPVVPQEDGPSALPEREPIIKDTNELQTTGTTDFSGLTPQTIPDEPTPVPEAKPIRLWDYDIGAKIAPQRLPGTESNDFEDPKKRNLPKEPTTLFTNKVGQILPDEGN